MPLLYADASALVKLVRSERESPALRSYIEGAELISSALVLAELTRAIRRAAALNPSLPLAETLVAADELLDALATIPLDRGLLDGAGAITEPALRTLDAIHVAAAASAMPLDAFVSYDERQSAAARLAGLRTLAPGT